MYHKAVQFLIYSNNSPNFEMSSRVWRLLFDTLGTASAALERVKKLVYPPPVGAIHKSPADFGGISRNNTEGLSLRFATYGGRIENKNFYSIMYGRLRTSFLLPKSLHFGHKCAPLSAPKWEIWKKLVEITEKQIKNSTFYAKKILHLGTGYIIIRANRSEFS